MGELREKGELGKENKMEGGPMKDFAVRNIHTVR